VIQFACSSATFNFCSSVAYVLLLCCTRTHEDHLFYLHAMVVVNITAKRVQSGWPYDANA